MTKSGVLAVDVQILELLGILLREEEEVKIPQTFLNRYAKKVGEETLIRIADDDGFSVNAHRAVAKLLGL